VFHGHISEAGTIVEGALRPDLVNAEIDAAVRAFTDEAGARLTLYQGPLSLRLTISAAGKVEACDVAADRVLHPNPGQEGWETLREGLCEHLEALRFPLATAATTVILPVMFGARPARLG
jgi:hypothetical protein